MLENGFTLNTFFMITGFLLAMFSCVSNDIIQTLGTFLTANKKTNSLYIWIFTSIILILTIGIGWWVNDGDLSFGRLDRIPVAHTFTIIHVLPPIILLTAKQPFVSVPVLSKTAVSIFDITSR